MKTHGKAFSLLDGESTLELSESLVEKIYKDLGKKLSALQMNPFSVPRLPSGINYKACILVKTLDVLSSCSEERKALICHDELQCRTFSENSKLQNRFESKAIKTIERK